ncbi:unnamed protein product [Brachionus calyciflorus]|uniref:Uncharacterized protein n=1 Tax=Brachionus calyciflorus TaxID=104777 RepID=A0A814N2N9_9BILA|nr:unnamed protein product [Brachionus calyciflorus]
MPPKKNKKAAAEAHLDFVTEADNEVSQKAVKVKNSEEIEMMAVKFIVLDPLHPFHRLNGGVLIKGTKVTFYHEMDEEIQIIDGCISHDKSFKVPKQKATKYLKDSKAELKQVAVDQTLSSISTQLAYLNENLSKSNEENQKLKSLLLENLSPPASRCTSPSVKRKNSNEIVEIETEEKAK